MKILVNKKRTIELKGTKEQCDLSIGLLERNGNKVEILDEKRAEKKADEVVEKDKAALDAKELARERMAKARAAKKAKKEE